MRATILSRAPRRRGLITGLVTASVLTLSLLAGGTALGANPNWIVGHGTDSAPTAPQPDSGASSSAVGAGRQVGFFEWLRNGGHEQHLAAVPDRVHDTERDRGRRDLDDQDRGGGNGPHRRLPGRDTADLRVRRAELRQHGLPRCRIHHAVDPGEWRHAGGPLRVQHHGHPGWQEQQPRRRQGDRRPGRGHQQRRRQRRLQPRPGQPDGRRRSGPPEEQEPAGDVRHGQRPRGRSGGR